MKETSYGITLLPKKYHLYMFLKIKDAIKESLYSKTDKVHFVDTLSRRTDFWDTAVPCGSKNSHNVVQLNPDEDKYYLLTPYPTLIQPLKKFSSESIRAVARNPNIGLQSVGIYSKSDIQHHIRTKHFKIYLQKWTQNTKDQNLRKLAETAGFSDIYAQDYSGF